MNLYNVRSKVSNNVVMTITAESEREALEIAVKRWDWDSYDEYCKDSYTGLSDLYAVLIK
jgi:hypothetical protein